MRIIECGEASRKASRNASTAGGKKSILPFRRKPDAQEVFTSVLSEALDNRFFLLNRLTLSGQGKLAPVLLVGPTGIWAVLPSSVAGIFRVNESTWEGLDEKSQRFGSLKPNLVVEVCSWAKAIGEYLTSQGIQTPPIEPVLFLSEPGAHIDSSRPAARIVLADGLPRFLTGLYQAQAVLDVEEIKQIIVGLAGEDVLQPTHLGAEIKDDYSFRERRAPEKPVPKPPEAPSRLSAMSREEPELVRQVSRRVPFTRKQWVWISVLFLLAMIMLVALVIVVVINP